MVLEADAYAGVGRPPGHLPRHVGHRPADRPLWASNTSGKGDSTLWMQGDGNLVLYAHNPAPATSTWASNTARIPTPKSWRGWAGRSGSSRS